MNSFKLSPFSLLLLLVLSLLSTAFAQAQTYSVLYNFCSQYKCPDGDAPSGSLVRDKNGNYYGMTTYGGAYGYGTIFELTASGAEKLVYSFRGGSSDGIYPEGPLLLDANGNLYGTAYEGGNYGAGIVFELTPSGTEEVLYNFTGGNDGGYPNGGLIRDSAGNLYGTTYSGGTYYCFEGYSCGVVFQLSPSGVETVLWAFTGGSDDGNPWAGVVQDSKGNFYGTTAQQNDFGPSQGTVYKLTPSGVLTTLYTFSFGTDGGSPVAPLVLDSQGNIYGTTVYGGSKRCYIEFYTGCGVVFEITTSGTERVRHTFTRKGKDGGYPHAGLSLDAKGDLFGATYYGGNHSCYDGTAYGCGVIFEIPKQHGEIVLHTFAGGSDGDHPSSAPVVDASGNLYGTALGGLYGGGVIYKITP